MVSSVGEPSLLSRMRNETRFCDATLVCKNGDIKLHAVVLMHASEFFENALTGAFKEATERAIALHDTSVEAAEVLVDYAYEVDVNEKLRDDLELALEVWSLAHLYDITLLANAAGKQVLPQVNPSNIGRLLPISRKLDSDILVPYSARYFGNIDYKELDAEGMKKILSSQELIATEWECVEALSEWYSHHCSDDDAEISLMHLLHFELLEYFELQALLQRKNLSLPQDLLANAVAASKNHFAFHSIDAKFCFSCNQFKKTKCHYCYPDLYHATATSVNITVSSIGPQQQTVCRTPNFVLSFEPICFKSSSVDINVVMKRRWMADSRETTFAKSVENLKIRGSLNHVFSEESTKLFGQGTGNGFDKHGQLLVRNAFDIRTAHIGDNTWACVNLTFFLY